MTPPPPAADDAGGAIDFDRIHDLILDLVSIQSLYPPGHDEHQRIQTLIDDLQLIIQLNQTQTA